MDTKINIYILSVFLKLHNFLITLTVTLAPSICQHGETYI